MKLLFYLFGSRKEVIHRNDGPYLVRYIIFNFRFIRLQVHNILLSDDACFHDHPWSFISFMLKGGYIEHFYVPGTNRDLTDHKFWGPWSLLYRPASYAHRLQLLRGKSAWTLVFSFKKVRDWGFFTSSGWVHWKEYWSKGGCE